MYEGVHLRGEKAGQPKLFGEGEAKYVNFFHHLLPLSVLMDMTLVLILFISISYDIVDLLFAPS